jgi:hypothetical protein
MARFRFFLIGTAQTPVLEVEARNIAELHADLARERFLVARTVEVDGNPVSCDVIVPVARIQMIADAASL